MKIKSKLVLVILLMIGFILMLGIMSKVIAADVTTVSENIGYARNVDIEVTMEATSGMTYKYAVFKDSTTTPGESDWKSMIFVNGKADITVNDANILKAGDKGYLWIAEVNGDVQTTIHEAIEVELPLPNIVSRFTISGIMSNTLKMQPIYGVTSGKYQFVKITDTAMINLLKNYYDTEDTTEKNQIMTQIIAKMPGEAEAPTSNWLNFTSDAYLTPPSLPTNETEAFFQLWMDTEATGVRKMIGVNPIKIYNMTQNNNDNNNNTITGNNVAGGNTNNGITTIVDNTTADKDLPKTGKDLVVIAIVTIVACGLVGYIRYKKLDIE